MNLRYKTLVAMLLAAMLTVAWMPVSPQFTQFQSHSRGCHGRGGSAPASDHRCCLTGHDVAAVETSHMQRLKCPTGCFTLDVPAASLAALCSFERSLANHGGDPPQLEPPQLEPPQLLPLRI